MRHYLFALSLLCCAAAPVFAQDNPQPTPVQDLKQAGREIGHATRDAAKDVGHATRDTTRAIGHASRDAARKAGHATRDVATKTGHAARDGAHDVRDAVTGDDKPAEPAQK